MILPISQLGQPVLREAATEVSPEELRTPEFQAFLKDMRETLASAGGIGLAAPQVFSSKRVFLAGILPSEQPEAPPGIEILINPKLTHTSTEKVARWEGCLSFPELLVLVPRHSAIRMTYLDAQGDFCVVDLHGFPARVVQHELDHLDGILTLDRAPSTRDIVKASEIETVLEDREARTPKNPEVP